MYIGHHYNEDKHRKQTLKQRRRQLDELSDAINQAYRTFNSISDPSALDACIFEINELRAKRDSVLRDIRKLE